MTLHEFSEAAVMAWGWVLIVLVTLSLLITWATIVPEIFEAICGCFKRFFKKEVENKDVAINEPKSRKLKLPKKEQNNNEA